MKRRKNIQSASIWTRPSLARMATPLDGSQSPKMTNVKALLSSGEPIVPAPVFQHNENVDELKPHGDPFQKGFHAVGAPLSRWRLIASAHCVRGAVHKADGGGAAGDSDTNFELVIPKFDATGGLSDEVKAINQKIDAINQEQNKTFEHINVFFQNNNPNDPDRIYIHCEVDRNRLAVLSPDLAGMMVGDCYEVCGQLVMDTFHGGLYEIHPVQAIDRC